MLLISTTVKPSVIHGLGCFTNEPIKNGQLIWVYDHQFDLSIKEVELSRFPKPIQDFLDHYCYTLIENNERCLVLCGDNSRYMNHSDNPNIINNPDGSYSNIACRDIDIGEELTCDYFSFDLDANKKLYENYSTI